MRHAPGRYILIGKLAVPEDDLFKWATWLERAERIVGRDKIGGVLVSTVFLGLDHNFSGGLPILFETMVFRGGASGDQDTDFRRYETWQEAEEGHEEIVAAIRAELIVKAKA